jgi:hypothetical protein
MDHATKSAPASTQRDDNEITPEMIEAGLAHLYGYSRERGREEKVVGDIYLAMREASARPKER